ncbi:MAG TPA: GAF domain-containing protein [Anaerolineales bacterium]
MATLVSFAVALFARSRRGVRGARAFLTFMVCVFVWTAGYTLELASNELPQKIFWVHFQFIGIAVLPLAWLSLSQQFSGREGRQMKWISLALMIIPTITVGLIWTNDTYGLAFSNPHIYAGGDNPQVEFGARVLIWLFNLYLYITILIGILFLLFGLVNSQRLLRSQILIFLLSMVIPLVVHALYIAGISPFPDLDLTPVAFVISGLVIAWGLFRLRMFDLLPIARGAVVDSMREGVIVLDELNRVVDLNAVAESIFVPQKGSMMGQSVFQIFSDYPDLVDLFNDSSEAQMEIAWDSQGEITLYNLRISPVFDRQRDLVGRLIVMSDVTTSKQAEQALRRQLEELRILHTIARAGAEATSEDTLIGHATRIIGEALYPDNFGLLMFDELAGCLRPHPSYHPVEELAQTLCIPLGQGICGKVAVDGLPRRVSEVSKEPAYIMVDERMRSELCVPLKIGERVIGVINAESAELDAFTEADELLLMTLAGQLATAIDRIRADSARNQHTGQLAILSQVSQEVVSSLVPEQVYAAIHQAAAQLMPTEAFVIALLDEAQKEIVPVYFYDRGGLVQAGSIPEGHGLSGHVIATGKPLLVGDRDQIGDLEVARAGDPEPSRSILAVPIHLGDKVVGMLSCQSYQPDVYSKENLQTLGTLANQAAIAIENARLFEETQRSLREITFLSQIIAITATESDLATALQRVCAELANFYHAPEVGFVLFNSQLTSAQVIAEYHEPDRPSSLGMQFPLNHNPAAAYLLRYGTYLAVSDALAEPLLEPLRETIRERGITSFLLIPIIFGGEVVGFLEIDDLRERKFLQDEIVLGGKVASQVSQVLERLGLFAATREQAERMAQLASLSEALNRPLTEEEVIAGIGEAGMDLGSADRAAVYILRRDGNVSIPWSYGLSEDYQAMLSRQIQDVPGGRLLQSTEPILISDLGSVPEKSIFRVLGDQEGYRAFELWPLIYEDQVIAAIGCYYNQVHPWSDAEQEVMLAFARQAAVALQNARLFDEARRRAAHLEALNVIITAVAGASDLQNLLEIALDNSLKALGLRMGGIWVGENMVLRKLPLVIGKASAGASTQLELAAQVAVVVDDWLKVDAEEEIYDQAALMQELGVLATITVPILSEGRRIGGLTVASAKARNWLAEEIALIEGVGRQLGGAVERIEMLEKIQDHAQQVRRIMDTVPEGVLMLDDKRQIVLANPVAQEYLEELAGLQVGDILPDLGGKPVSELLDPNVQILWYELEIAGPPRKVFELAVQPLEEGEYSGGWVLVLREMTQERENQARIQMQDRLATVGQLAAGIAHDFNNIMAAIVVYADLLRRDPNLLPTSRDRLAIIQNQVQRAASLIRQILDFSRRSVMEQTTLDLLPFIKELDKLLRRVLPETIRIELSYQPGEYVVSADPTRLQQVFMNLAVNASDATPNGGRLYFQLERVVVEEGERPPCADLPLGEWIRISVQDTGEGIPPEVLPHIFEPFFTTKPVGQGTGLGLAQAYGIIRQHDGYIDVHSQVGEGTTFHIYLKAQGPALPEESLDQAAPELHGTGEMLLVVEDDPAAREAMRALLEAYNYQVLTATNGAEALRIYEQRAESIELVVSDIVMPVMGGMALYQALSQQWPQVKMLFVTGHPVREQEQDILERGNVHWLQKPFSVQIFSRVVHDLLNELS